MTAHDPDLTADADKTRLSHAATYAGIIRDNMIVAYHAKPSYEGMARDSLHELADLMGFVAMPKADHLAMTALIEELRDFKPSVISGRAHDPQDDLDDVMPVAEFEAFQDDAAKLMPRKAVA